MMAARNKAINKYISANPGASKFEALSKLVCYASIQVISKIHWLTEKYYKLLLF